MTDKEKLNRVIAEIKRLQQKVINGATSGQYSSETIREKNQLLVNLLSFIDSMQGKQVDYGKLKTSLDNALAKETKESWEKFLKEESTTSLWHDASEKAENGKLYLYQTNQNIVGINRSEGKKFPDYCERWAYIDDIIKLSNVERIGKDWKEEPVSEDLNTAAKVYADNITDKIGYKLQLRRAVVYGANWQIGQFEKNRLAACDRQTEAEAEIERDFVVSIIEKEHRPPTFDDAIKYGMRLKEEQMMAKGVDGVVHRFDGDGLAAIHYNDPKGVPMCYYTSPSGLEAGDKVKLILVKED